MPADIEIEVVYALPGRQRLVSVTLPETATVGDAIRASGLAREFPGEGLDARQVGVWGRVVERDQRLSAGDRVEIYRPLLADPREARRRLAAAGQTMAGDRDA